MANHSQSERGMNESSLSDAALAELMTLTVEGGYSVTVYRNQQGRIHRVHGPAIFYHSGSRHWYLNGFRHRTDGPAVEWADSTISWYLYDQELTEEEFNERVKSV